MEIKRIGFILLMLAMLVVPTMAATPVPEPRIGEEGWFNPSGALYVSVMCHHNLISKDVLIYRIADNNTISFINGDRVLKETYDMVPKMSDSVTIPLNAGGQFDVFFNPGSYALKLLDGNGGQPEYALVTLYPGGARSNVIFIGHAVSFDHGEAQCVPDETFTIVSAKYGAMGEECTDVPNNDAHTEYAYWITGVPEHTEYSFRDWIPAGMMEVCYPEVNHTVHHDAVTHQEYVPEVNHTVYHEEVNHTVTVVDKAAWTELKGDYNLVQRGGSPNYDAIFVGDDQGRYIIEFRLFKNGDYNRDGMSNNYKYVGDGCGWFDVVEAYIDHPEITHTEIVVDHEAYTEIIVDEAAHYHTIIDKEAYDEIVVDTPAHCEQEVNPDSPAHWSDWSAYSDTPVVAIPEQREVRTQVVPDDMSNGHYSEWSDTPEGSCISQMEASVEFIPVNVPCITREVPATTHRECEDVGLYVDVTSQVQGLADDSINSFVFRNDLNPGGVFSTTGTLLIEIADPAPGIVKTVEIEYNNGCTGDKTINAAEYEIINLV